MERKSIVEALINITNSNFGYIPTSPVEFNELARAIQKETGRPLSLSSIKRLWGYVKYDGEPSVTTLNTLARFNGYNDWDSFRVTVSGSSPDGESGFLARELVNAANINVGERLLLKWNDNKSCEIECIGEMRFRINRSANIKLEPGDTFNLTTICVGHPLYISDIDRGDVHIPAYYGARKGGILSITFLQ